MRALDVIKLIRNLFVMKTGLKFRVFLRFDLESSEKAVVLILSALYNFLKWFVHKFLAAV